MSRLHSYLNTKLYLYLIFLTVARASLWSEPFSWIGLQQGWNDCLPGSEQIELRAELLYFKPTIDNSYFVITSTNNVSGENIFPNGTRHNNSPSFECGYRLEATYKPCNCFNDLDFRFTSLSAHHSKSISGAFLFDTIGYPGDGAQSPEDTAYNGTAYIKDHFRYYAGDLTFNRITLNCCPENLSFLIGLHYTYIHFKGVFHSFGLYPDGSQRLRLDNHLKRKSHFCGIGPEFGINYSCLLPSFICCNVGQIYFNADGRTALLCSKTKADFHYQTLRTSKVGVNLRNKALWRVTPTADARLGLSYEFCYCGLEGVLEVGYEFVWYSNCIDSITGYDVAYAGNSLDSFSNLNMQGAYFALGFDF